MMVISLYILKQQESYFTVFKVNNAGHRRRDEWKCDIDSLCAPMNFFT